MPFSALTELDKRLEEVRALQSLNPVAVGSLPATKGAAQADTAVNRASVVLLCSHLEAFVEQLLSEGVDTLLISPLPRDRISNQLRYKHGIRGVREVADISNADSFAQSFAGLISQNSALLTSPMVRRQDVDADLLCQDFADPRPDKIFGLFGVLGLSKREMIAAFGSYRLSQAVVARVGSLVSVRHEIAHGGSLQATRGDVVGYMAAVRLLGSRLDLAVDYQVHLLRAGPGKQTKGLFARRKIKQSTRRRAHGLRPHHT